MKRGQKTRETETFHQELKHYQMRLSEYQDTRGQDIRTSEDQALNRQSGSDILLL